jgi:hypothetical protein
MEVEAANKGVISSVSVKPWHASLEPFTNMVLKCASEAGVGGKQIMATIGLFFLAALA